jgi:hypothetical protein
VLFPRHLTPQRMTEVISHIQTFRDYFQYHIKASKAYIHSRMRKRTADFLQGMNLVIHTPSPELTAASASQSQTRQRGEGEEDGERKDFQGARGLNCVEGPSLIVVTCQLVNKLLLIDGHCARGARSEFDANVS